MASRVCEELVLNVALDEQKLGIPQGKWKERIAEVLEKISVFCKSCINWALTLTAGALTCWHLILVFVVHFSCVLRFPLSKICKSRYCSAFRGLFVGVCLVGSFGRFSINSINSSSFIAGLACTRSGRGDLGRVRLT